jgi:hypothetical protein
MAYVSLAAACGRQSDVHATGADLRDAIGRLSGNQWETKKTPVAKSATEVTVSPTRSGREANEGAPVAPKKKTAADVFREIGRWEGETGAELDALFKQQPGNRQVPDLK